MRAPAATAYQQKINTLCAAIGHSFADLTLLELALIHRSCGHHNNERLEFLGDSLLNNIIAELVYKKFTSASEGELTRVRANLVNKASLLACIFKILSSHKVTKSESLECSF